MIGHYSTCLSFEGTGTDRSHTTFDSGNRATHEVDSVLVEQVVQVVEEVVPLGAAVG